MYLFVLKCLSLHWETFRTCVKQSKNKKKGTAGNVYSHTKWPSIQWSASVSFQARVGFKIISNTRSYGFHSSGVNGAESDGVALGLVAVVLGLFVGCHWPGENDPAVVDADSR